MKYHVVLDLKRYHELLNKEERLDKKTKTVRFERPFLEWGAYITWYEPNEAAENFAEEMKKATEENMQLRSKLNEARADIEELHRKKQTCVTPCKRLGTDTLAFLRAVAIGAAATTIIASIIL